jgi:hypothetical protein
MLDRVVSGGQTGADQAGWRAARAAGIPTGAWMTWGFLTEAPDGRGDEPHPEFADLYGARELPTANYADRTRANVRDSEATIWFGSTDSLGPGRSSGILTPICCHSFRATGITNYLLKGGTLEKTQRMANHESAKTTKLYDRRDELTLDEVERISI